MAEFDTIIKDGMIVDGTRVPRYKADVGIKDGKIAKIGRLNTSDAGKVLDASGQIVAPGYIDLHTHYDAQIHWDPYCTIASSPSQVATEFGTPSSLMDRRIERELT